MSITPPKSFAEVLAEQAAERARLAADVVSQQPFHVALVIDGIAAQVFHCDEKLAAILLSNPTIVQVDSPANGGPNEGWDYNSSSNTFTAPSE